MVIQTSRTQRKLFRIPQAVDYLGGAVKAATLRQWVWRRQIEFVRLGGAVCIPQEALDKLIEQGTVPALESQSR
jgi:excisionase family DNA binding protein